MSQPIQCPPIDLHPLASPIHNIQYLPQQVDSYYDKFFIQLTPYQEQFMSQEQKDVLKINQCQTFNVGNSELFFERSLNIEESEQMIKDQTILQKNISCFSLYDETEDRNSFGNQTPQTPGFTSSQFRNDASPIMKCDTSPCNISSFGFIEEDSCFSREASSFYIFGDHRQEVPVTSQKINEKQYLSSFGNSERSKNLQNFQNNGKSLGKLPQRKILSKRLEETTSQNSNYRTSTKQTIIKNRKGSFNCLPENIQTDNDNDDETRVNSVIESSFNLNESLLNGNAVFQQISSQVLEEPSNQKRILVNLQKHLEQINELFKKIEKNKNLSASIVNSYYTDSLNKIRMCLKQSRQLKGIPLLRSSMFSIQFQILQHKFKMQPVIRQKANAFIIQKIYQRAFPNLKKNLQVSLEYASKIKKQKYEELKEVLCSLYSNSQEMALQQEIQDLNEFIGLIIQTTIKLIQAKEENTIFSPFALDQIHNEPTQKEITLSTNEQQKESPRFF